MAKTKKIKAWVDIGSHGGIFEFQLGPVAERYPKLMHVYSVPHKGLVPCTISYSLPITKKKK